MGIVIGIAVIVVVVFWFRRAADRPELDSSEVDLLHLCGGDKSQMERLVALEHRNRPGTTRLVAVAQAIRALRRDKR
ncbi:MAG: hypothetical protein SXG53_14565 [Pseudomonadota bacterium]|nr:hypothetical protein [Pseudomonadota bacterium]